MPRGAGGGGAEFRVDVSEWMATAEKIGIAAKLLQPAATASVRSTARSLASRAKTEVMATPLSGGGGPHSGLRGRIRDGITVENIPLGAEVRADAFLSRQYNGTWRHPVFGHDVWVSQTGMPYWSDTFDNAETVVAPRFAAMVLAALHLL